MQLGLAPQKRSLTTILTFLRLPSEIQGEKAII